MCIAAPTSEVPGHGSVAWQAEGRRSALAAARSDTETVAELSKYPKCGD